MIDYNGLQAELEMIFAKRFIDKKCNGTIRDLSEVARKFKLESSDRDDLITVFRTYNLNHNYAPFQTDAMARVFLRAMMGMSAYS